MTWHIFSCAYLLPVCLRWYGACSDLLPISLVVCLCSYYSAIRVPMIKGKWGILNVWVIVAKINSNWAGAGPEWLGVFHQHELEKRPFEEKRWEQRKEIVWLARASQVIVLTLVGWLWLVALWLGFLTLRY